MKPEYIQQFIRLATLFRSAGEMLGEGMLSGDGTAILDLIVADELPAVQRCAAIKHLAVTDSYASGILAFRANHDYGEVWPKVLDDYRKGKVKTITDFIRKKRRAQLSRRKKASYISPIDSYCNSKRNIEYWSQLLDGNPSQAVIDFINYAKQVSCSGCDNGY